MSLKSAFVCNICKLVLKDPVQLQCSDLVCGEHLYNGTAKNSSIRCMKCDEDFEVPEQGFEANQTMALQIEKELNLTADEKYIKHVIQKLIQKLEQLQYELKQKYFDLERVSYDHFSEVRRKIDLQREELKVQIDDISKRLHDQTDKKEKLYTLKMKETLLVTSPIDIQKSRDLLMSEFRNPNIAIEKVNRMHNEHKQKVAEFEAKVNEYDALKDELQSLDFKAGLEFKEVLFGRLITSKLVACTVQNTVQLLNLESKEFEASLEEHSRQISCLENIDENRFASGSRDQTIIVWDIQSHACLRTLIGHHNSVNILKTLSPSRLASGSYREIRIWSIESGNCRQMLNGHLNWITGLVCLPNGHLVSCSADTIKVWNLEKGSCLKTITGQSSAFFCLLLMKDGLLASGSDDKTIKIWSLDRSECVKTLRGHSLGVYRLQALESGELISCSWDSTIKIWDLKEGGCIRTLVGHTQLVTSIRIYKQNSTLVSCSEDKTIKIWDLKTCECIYTFEVPTRDGLSDLIFI